MPADPENPFRSPPPPLAPTPMPAGPSVPPFSRFGDILGRAFNSYFKQWSAWPLVVLVFIAIAIASSLACVIPSFLAQGPLICGLYWCAICNLRGWPVDTAALSRGWQLFWPAMSSGIALMLLQAMPALLIGAVMFGGLIYFGVAVLPAAPGGKPDPEDVARFMIGMMGSWMLLLLVASVWTLWIGTRTMFVMPLVADRGYDFSSAFKASWEATRYRFWERLLLIVLASFLSSVGINLCYVGVLFTLPFQFLIIAAAYEDEFGIEGLPPPTGLPGGSGESPFQSDLR